MTSGVPIVASGLIVVVVFAVRTDTVQQAAFSSRAEIVQLDVSVRLNDRVVLGLRPEDFDVRDNGVRQVVTVAAFDDVPINATLALDMSSSVQGGRLADLRAAANGFFALLTPRDAAAVLGFSDRVALLAPFTSDRGQLQAALAAAFPPGDTALADALYTALLLSDDRAGRPVVVVFSDAADTGSVLSREQVLEAARRTRAVVYSVVSDNQTGTGVLDDAVRATGGRRFEATSGGLTEAFAAVLSASKERYLLSDVPAGTDEEGWHELSVRVPSLPGAQTEARPGYLVRR